MRAKDGSWRWFRSCDTPYQWTVDGRLQQILGTATDMTARKEAERHLRESEERFRSIYEHAATGIAITDLDGRFRQCNPAYCATLGYTEEELRRLSFAELVHPEDRAANLMEIRRLVAEELPYFEIENRYVHKCGASVWVHKFISLLRDHRGKPMYLVALVTDVTERHKAEQLVRETRRNSAVSRGIWSLWSRNGRENWCSRRPACGRWRRN